MLLTGEGWYGNLIRNGAVIAMQILSGLRHQMHQDRKNTKSNARAIENTFLRKITATVFIKFKLTSTFIVSQEGLDWKQNTEKDAMQIVVLLQLFH